MFCALCDAPSATPVTVSGGPPAAVDLCARCAAGVGGDLGESTHWFCLQGAIWSEVPAVQVVAWRLLQNLSEHTWASDLLEQVYLDEAVLEWARAQALRVVDSNGTPLADGDAVTLIKDLDVKGANFTAKRGTLVKNIRLGEDPSLVEGKVNGTAIYLKTSFLKKV